MDRLTALAVAIAALAAACTPVEPAIDVLDDFDEPALVDDAESRIPEGERITWPTERVEAQPTTSGDGTSPRLAIVAGGEHEDCYVVRAHGFPAIDDDGEIAIPLAHVLMLSNRPGSLDLEWLAEDGAVRKDPIVTDDDMHDGQESCERFRRKVGARVRASNKALASRTWHSLEPLPLELPHPEYYDPTTAAETQPDERPVQALVRHGELIVRIPGVRVLERHPIDRPHAYLHRILVDRESSTALVIVALCEGEDCSCDPGFFAYRMQWQDSTFAAIDRHPCVSEGSENTCDMRALPFEAPMEPWAL